MKANRRDVQFAFLLSRVGHYLFSQNRLVEAYPLLQELLKINREILPEKHLHIALILNNLAGVYSSQNRLEEALPLYREALAILEETLGTDHPNTQLVAENLQGLLEQMQLWSIVRG